MDMDVEARTSPPATAFARTKFATLLDGMLSAGTFTTLAALIFWLISRFVIRAGGPRVIPFYVADASHWQKLAENDSVRVLEVGLVVLGFIVLMFPFELIFGRHNRWLALLRAFQFGFGLVTAALISDAFTNIGKIQVGGLRPDFYERCFGAGTAPPATSDLSTVVMSNSDCPVKDMDLLDQGRRSFPSGHASLAFSGCFFMVLYLINYARRLRRPLIAQVFVIIAFVPLGYAFHVAISRVTDFRHFPVDVVGGAIVGLISSCLVFLWVLILTEVGKAPQH